MYWPVRKLARDGQHSGVELWKSVNVTPWVWKSAFRLGIQSVKRPSNAGSSSVMKTTMFGGVAAPPAAGTTTTERRTTESAPQPKS